MKARDPLDIGDGLSQRLVHVGAGMEVQLEQADVLDRLGLDVLDAVDVEEVIFVVVDQVAFHLRGVHAAVGLGHVDDGQVEVRKDVAGHPFDREP